jgi:PhnB protein
MTKLNPYLNFDGTCEEAFLFYQSVFGGEFMGGIFRMGDAPGMEHLSDKDKNKVMHMALPVGTDLIMGSDILPDIGHILTVGNNNQISIFPDSREDAERLFNGLSAGGKIIVPLQDQFWGDYYGNLIDKFGVAWMINYSRQMEP